MLSAASSASSMDALRITAPDLVVTLPAWIAAFAACEVRAGKSAMRWRPIADREQRRQAHRARGAEATCDEQRVHSHEVARDDQLREQSGHEDDVRGRDHRSKSATPDKISRFSHRCGSPSSRGSVSQSVSYFTVPLLQGLPRKAQIRTSSFVTGRGRGMWIEVRSIRDTQTDLDSHWSEGRTEGRP